MYSANRRPRLAHLHAEPLELDPPETPADPEDGPSSREVVEHREALGDPHGVVPRQNRDHGAELDPGRLAGQPRQDHRRLRGHLVVGEMVLGHPNRVEARPPRLARPGRAPAVDLSVGVLAVEVLQCDPEAYVHEHLLSCEAVHGKEMSRDQVRCRLLRFDLADRSRLPELARPPKRRTPSRPAPRRCAGPAGRVARPISGTVRLKRGAGAGWTTPSISMKVCRPALCGWSRASSGLRTGAKQASVPSNRAHHSSRVLVRTSAAMRCFIDAHEPAVRLVGYGPGAVDVLRQPGETEKLLARAFVDRAQRDVAAVGGLVDLVEPGTGVEEVGAPLGPQSPTRPEPVDHPGQQTRHRRPWRRRSPGPTPDLSASRIPHTMPNASMSPPPPKSPTRLRGGTGG